MAQSPMRVVVEHSPVRISPRDVRRIAVALVGTAVLLASILSPWWTRGVSIDGATIDASERPPGIEGFYMNYGPFATPGSLGGFTTDSSRAAAVAVLGVSLLLCGAFLAGHHLLRFGALRGRIEVGADVPVRFAIAAFTVGLFAVLWGLLFLPLLGSTPGFMWGTEYGGDLARDGLVTTRFANVGFYLGVVGAVLYPAYVWRDAALARQAHEASLGVAAAAGSRPAAA